MLRVGWILTGPRTVPSARIEGYNLHTWLNKNGHTSYLLYTPPIFTHGLNTLPPLPDVDIIIFQKVFKDMVYYALPIYKKKGIKIVYYVTDFLPGFEYMFENSDRVIVSSTLLKESAGEKYANKISMLKDAYETPKELCKTNYETDQINVAWFGMSYNFERAESFRPLIESLGYKFITITDHPKANKQWSEETIAQDLIDSDIVIIPPDITIKQNLYKDENK